MNDNTHGTNILILGSDTRDLEDNVYGDAGGDRSDAMVLAHLSEDESRIEAVQIPRDTMMDLRACDDTGHGSSAGGYGAVNSALNAGPACSVAAVESLSGVRLDHFIEMNFEGFTTMVDALDGVPVCLPEPLQDTKASLDLPAGDQIVDGRDALALARTRHAVGDGSDIARMGHQQQVMSAIVQRAKSTDVLVRPDRLYGFLDAVTASLTVDDDLDSLTALASLATTAAQVADDRISFEVMPWEPEPTDPNRVVPSAEAADIFQRIRTDAPLEDDEEETAPEVAAGGCRGRRVRRRRRCAPHRRQERDRRTGIRKRHGRDGRRHVRLISVEDGATGAVRNFADISPPVNGTTHPASTFLQRDHRVRGAPPREIETPLYVGANSA